jgi:hypothetical protein
LDAFRRAEEIPDFHFSHEGQLIFMRGFKRFVRKDKAMPQSILDTLSCPVQA